MAYEHFAYVYDHLMQDVPYDNWVSFVRTMKERHLTDLSRGFTVLDVGCGTGELALRFAKEGWKVSGVDLSESMLTVAQEKAEKAGASITFFEQNMAELDGFSGTDCVTIFCDSINYLQTEADTQQTFQAVYRQLKKGGLFFFDVHSIYKMSQIFMNNTFASDDEEVAYIWNSFPGEHPNSVEHDLSFFVQEEHRDTYQRFNELHKQRTFPVEIYKSWLLEAGFTVLAVTGDFSTEHLEEYAERVFFVAQK
ncbi:Ubiquinone biosynthesis O-methyltransferase [Bacillus sp. THAF10]|uniref:class I SAM-dependent DNA methyltransferase n=1 Tax=Bacillus sp. THAF10 TaxID=2587848 RepID=UPI0012688418|nr:class I SAM-dependent methyltransferase [Bacillus sp. THAF10]QFT89927.1 Ubiquinone biosynthesis O-methyltransferase [Bacillus sp. THAF10]